MSLWNIFFFFDGSSLTLVRRVGRMSQRPSLFSSFSVSFFNNKYFAAGNLGLITNRPKNLKSHNDCVVRKNQQKQKELEKRRSVRNRQS